MSKATTKAKRTGRKPEPISGAVKDRICREVALGRSLRKLLKAAGMPHKSKVMEELQRDASFADQYARARKQGIELHIDELLDLADSANARNAQAVRLKVDVRKWLASKLVPRVYGDKLELGAAGMPDPMDLRDAHTSIGVARRVAFALAHGAMVAAAKAGETAAPALPAPVPDPVYRDSTPAAEVRAAHPGAHVEHEINPRPRASTLDTTHYPSRDEMGLDEK